MYAEELNLDGAFNYHRWIFNAIECSSDSMGTVVFPINTYNRDLTQYDNENYIVGNFFNGTTTISDKEFNNNSLSIILRKDQFLINIAKALCKGLEQDVCLLKSQIDNRLYVIRNDKK